LIAKLPLRRLTLIVALALSLGALAVSALLRPTQTLAQTHKAAGAACSSSGEHAKARRAHSCAKPAHKGRPRRAAKHRVKRTHAKAKGQDGSSGRGGSSAGAFVPARCEDGSAPVAGADGSLTCEDGSEPRCEDGATPTRSSNGTRLLCASTGEGPSGESEAECEEREEEGLSCATEGGEEVCELTEGPGCETAG
jgi:hypothetical protein